MDNIFTHSNTKFMIVILYACPACAFAENNAGADGSLTLSLGYLGGEAKEYVYNGDRKLSELTWKTKNAAIIRINASRPVLTWLDVNFYGWSTLVSSNGSQSDRDWRDPDPAPENNTLNSVSHSSSDVNYANMFDVGLTSWLYQNERAKFGLLAGYKESRFSWTAHGGYFQDFDDPTQNQQLNGKIIGYKQTYKTPYIGAVAQFDLNEFSFKTEFKYSNWVKAEDYDNHYLRKGFKSSNKSSSSVMYSVSQEVAYTISPLFQVVAEAAWNQYEKHKADTSGTTEFDGNGQQESYYLPRAGGLSSYDYTLSAGIRYFF